MNEFQLSYICVIIERYAKLVEEEGNDPIYIRFTRKNIENLLNTVKRELESMRGGVKPE